MLRQSWDKYFLDIVKMVSTRATCTRGRVGAIMVDSEHRILATGYNGAPRGEPHCIDVGCNVVDDHCIRVDHAEINMLDQLYYYDTVVYDTTVYIYVPDYPTHMSCKDCREALEAYGVREIVSVGDNEDEVIRDHLGY